MKNGKFRYRVSGDRCQECKKIQEPGTRLLEPEFSPYSEKRVSRSSKKE
jgi:hypothetical protein